MRTIWNGSISFGLVTIPVGLAVAQQRKDVSFRTLHRECGTPIKQKRWCPTHEREVEADELVKGWEFTKGQFVMVEDSDLEAVALQRSHAVDIVKFVPVEEVDPIYFDRTYYLAPADAPAQRRPYALLLAAMKDTGLGAVGKFVLWGKENLCLIRPLGDSLALETLYFAEDVRSREEIDEAVAEVKVAKAELDMARQLVESLSGSYDPEEFRNEYRDQLNAMLEAKVAGEEIVAPEPQEEGAPVIDLLEALKQSVAQAGKREATEKKPAARKKAASGGRKRASARS
jgi:DNA end-binding protein Ku